MSVCSATCCASVKRIFDGYLWARMSQCHRNISISKNYLASAVCVRVAGGIFASRIASVRKARKGQRVRDGEKKISVHKRY